MSTLWDSTSEKVFKKMPNVLTKMYFTKQSGQKESMSSKCVDQGQEDRQTWMSA